MKRLHSFFFSALAASVLTFSASSVMAQPPASLDFDRSMLIAQSSQGTIQSASEAMKCEKGSHQNHSHKQYRGHISAAPANGMYASKLIGADVKIADGETVGSVEELIIDKHGQVVAIVVGVGGFLGMGDKGVAIGWDNVKKSGPSDDEWVRVDVTRKDLTSAPEFEKQD